MDPSLFALHVWHCLRMRLCWQMLPPPHSLPQMESLELQALWVQTVKSNLVKLLEVWRHRVVIICLARLARAPYPIVLADAPPSALLALAPLPMVPADARTSAFLASAPSPIVLADARPSALLARVPDPIVLADTPSSALLAEASLPLVLTDACPTALLAPAPLPVVLTFYLRSLPAHAHPAAPSLASVWRRPLPAALSTRSLTTALSLPLIRCPAAA